jgi:hypothetical protein
MPRKNRTQIIKISYLCKSKLVYIGNIMDEQILIFLRNYKFQAPAMGSYKSIKDITLNGRF